MFAICNPDFGATLYKHIDDSHDTEREGERGRNAFRFVKKKIRSQTSLVSSSGTAVSLLHVRTEHMHSVISFLRD